MKDFRLQMRDYGLLVFIALFFSSFLFSEESDSANTYRFDDVVVMGIRSEILQEKLSSSVFVISSARIESNVGMSLSSAVNGTSGMFLKSYGGIGSLQTISLRGMSAENTLILIDGMRFSSFQNGLRDVGIFSSSNIERIEILKGGSSAIYGADAVGGVVNIITKRTSDNFQGMVSSSLGSYGFASYGVNMSTNINSEFSFRANARKESGEGNYKFYFDDGEKKTIMRRNGGDYSLSFFDGRIDLDAKENFSSFISMNIEHAQRGVPNSVSSTTDLSKTRLNDNNVRTHFGLEWKQNETFSTQFNSSFHYGEETYDNPFISARDNYFNRNGIIEPSLKFFFSPYFSGTLGSELSRSWIQSNRVKNIVREQQSIFLSLENTLSTFSNAPIEAILFPSIRYDNFSDVGNAVSSKIGINIGISRLPGIRFRSSYGSSFHVPTFNDLYWLDGGNPNLKPEHSTSFDCGIISSFDILGNCSLEANYFVINTRDRILWKPQSNGIWSPKNIGKVCSEGIELEGMWETLEDKFSLTVNSTINTVKKMNRDFPNDATYGKQLVYLPLQTFNVAATISEYAITFSLQHSWTSYRYVTEMNDRFLPQYNVTNASLLYQFDAGTVQPFFKIETTNFFNTSYNVLPLYPMPLREFHFTLGIKKL